MRYAITFFSLIIAVSWFGQVAHAQESCVSSQCHAAFSAATAIHPPDKGCGACHIGGMEKHGPDGRSMEIAARQCDGCHAELFAEKPYPHAPVTGGQCHICHTPHGDAGHSYLRAGQPGGLYVNYSENEYQLCFSCHKRDLLMFPDTSFYTEFRDGERNLHYLHVNKADRGRNCSACHNPHGGGNPKLISDNFNFGNWRFALHFQKSENGGSCAPGCHRPQNYDRNKQGKTP